jgi:DNA-binding beta-propeller fold protein YncE
VNSIERSATNRFVARNREKADSPAGRPSELPVLDDTFDGSSVSSAAIGHDHGHHAPGVIQAEQLLVAIEGGGALELDPRTGAVVNGFRPATGNAFGAVYTADGARAFITDKDAGVLRELDTETGEVLQETHVGPNPQQPALTADGRMYIPLSHDTEGGIAVVDINDPGAPVRRIDTGAGSKPHILSLSPDGKTLWGTVQGSNPRVIAIPVTGNGEGTIKDFRYDVVPRVLVATDKGAFFTGHHSTGLHFANLSDGSISTPYMDVFGSFSEPRKQIEGVAATPDGKTVAITHEGRRATVVLQMQEDGTARKLLDVGPLANSPYWVTLDPSGEAMFVSIPGAGTVEAYDIASGSTEPLWSANVGGKPKRMAVSAAA